MSDLNEPAEYLYRRQAEVARRLGLSPDTIICHDCDPVECDEVTVAAFMATQEGKGQS